MTPAPDATARTLACPFATTAILDASVNPVVVVQASRNLDGSAAGLCLGTGCVMWSTTKADCGLKVTSP
jgi:hypothetical protein